MNGIFLMLALFLALAAAVSLKLSQGFSKRLPALAMVAFSVLSLALLSLEWQGHRTHRHHGAHRARSRVRLQRSPRPTRNAPCPRRLGTRPHRLLRSRAGLALVAHSPPPGTFPRHQPGSASRSASHYPGPLPQLVVCARLLRHQRRSAPLRRQFHGARSTPRLRRM